MSEELLPPTGKSIGCVSPHLVNISQEGFIHGKRCVGGLKFSPDGWAFIRIIVLIQGTAGRVKLADGT